MEMSDILTSLHGRLLGLSRFGQLVCPAGYVGKYNPMTAGAGITGGVGAVYKSNITKIGGIIRTQIFIDLTGLASSTTDLDIIGVGASAAYIAQLTAALNGTPFAGRMSCLETPAGGADDIDLYEADEATGAFDAGIGTLAETILLTSGAAWTVGVSKALTGVMLANKYLYLTGGEAGTAATYTAGHFLIEIEGYAEPA
jgi:hypothetical protein